jgi:hypothetical protein
MKKIKHRLLLSWLFVLLTYTSVFAQTSVLNSISAAMRSGDVGGVTRFMDNVVDITVNNNQSTYSKTQAEMVLRDFFAKNAPKGFNIEHTGNSADQTSFYSIGYLATAGGKYRIYIFLKLKDSSFVLQELKFEK